MNLNVTEKLSMELREAENEATKTYDVVSRIINLGILYKPHDEESFGFNKSVPKYGNHYKYGWEREFVPVVKLNIKSQTIAWAPDIHSPEKLLIKMITKYREKNKAVNTIEL